MPQALTLYELNTMVRSILSSAMDDEYWVCGELAEGRLQGAGHYYGELIERDDTQRAGIAAKARITIWAGNYTLLSRGFEQATGRSLSPGIKLMLKVKVSFHAAYGYSLNVLDIDPTYTIGDLAQKRRAILAQLEADGILHDNKQLPLPPLLKHIAIISSPTAAGYGDFCRHLEQNEWGFAFDHRLYPATMQGEHLSESIIAALQAIWAEPSPPDLIVIIRGGGATSDLSDFDSYPLAACIAQSPIPVLAGIGHERDQTVLDHVAHTSVKTPTAAAAYIIDHQQQQLARLQDLQRRITQNVTDRLSIEKSRIERHTVYFPLAFGRMKERCISHLAMQAQRLRYILQTRLQDERHRLTVTEQHIKSMDPMLLLQRGYSITTVNGKIIKSIDQVDSNQIETHLADGTISSEIITKHPKHPV